ncbi:MAG: alpha/beta hydrolase [Pseudomonadota bacterium]
MKTVSFLALVLFAPLALAQQTIRFAAEDGLEITADLYPAEDAKQTVLVLFHQAGSSRGEYQDIAPQLNGWGYTAMAIDQRSGRARNGVRNDTARAAKRAGKDTEYLDARADLLAAVAYAKDSLGATKVVVWGSSYSASLVLALAGHDPNWADGVLAFSPGEYFQGKLAVAKSARGLAVPTFITSAKGELGSWASISEAIDADRLTAFAPTGPGKHGSSTLLPVGETSQEYWDAVQAFLSANF